MENLATLLILSIRVRQLTDSITFLSGLCKVCRHGEIRAETPPYTRNNIARNMD